MSDETSSAVLVFQEYGLHCEVATRGGRLLDVLNDRTTALLAVTGCRYFHRRTSQPVLDVPSAVVRKSSVEMAVLEGEKGNAARRLYFATLERNRCEATICLPTAIVQGTLQLKSTNDASSFLTIEAGAFFPVTSAKILHFAAGAAELESPVVLVSKEFVGSISLES